MALFISLSFSSRSPTRFMMLSTTLGASKCVRTMVAEEAPDRRWRFHTPLPGARTMHLVVLCSLGDSAVKRVTKRASCPASTTNTPRVIK